MADVNTALETLKNLLASAEDKVASFKKQLLGLGDSAAGAEDLKNKLAAAEGQTSMLSSAISILTGGLSKLTEANEEVKRAVIQANPEFMKFGSTLINNLGPAIKNSAELFGISLSSSMRSLYNPLDDTKNAIGMIGMVSKNTEKALRGLDEASKNLITVQDQVRTAFVTGGRIMVDADKAAKTYAQGLRDASSATSFSTKDIAEFNKQVGRYMPEDMMMGTKSIAEVTDVMGKSVMPTTVAMTAFRAFGITGAEAFNKTKDAILKFNQDSVETARQLGIMKRAANLTGVEMGVAERQITQASQHLAIFGQRTGAATGLWSTFMGTLKDKVPVEEVGNMVSQLSANLAKMSMQNRAFISMMSGLGRGRTALGGALKMELEMRGPEGMQKHLQGLTRTLGRFAGGRIISLEQAARNPQLEQQFVLQRQMLGKLAGITDQEQQNRVLETLQKVQSGGMTQIEASGVLKEVLNDGKNLQKKQLTVLEGILQHMRAAFGGRLDTKLDDATNTIRQSFGPLQKTLQEGAGDPNRNVLNQDAFMPALTGTTEKIALAIKEMAGVPLQLGNRTYRYGREGVQPTAPDIGARILGSSGLRRTPGAGRRSLRPSDVAAGRVRAPMPVTIAGFRNLNANVSQGNQTIHRDLQHLIRTTRDGLSALKEGKAAGEPTVLGGTRAAGARENIITVRIVGDEDKVLRKLSDEISRSLKEFETKQQKNTLGIYE